MNSGIHLTTRGSKVLQSLEKLQRRGARIATCGTCLDYHDIRDELVIREVGSMEATVQIMTTADRVIRPC